MKIRLQILTRKKNKTKKKHRNKPLSHGKIDDADKFSARAHFLMARGQYGSNGLPWNHEAQNLQIFMNNERGILPRLQLFDDLI